MERLSTFCINYQDVTHFYYYYYIVKQIFIYKVVNTLHEKNFKYLYKKTHMNHIETYILVGITINKLYFA